MNGSSLPHRPLRVAGALAPRPLVVNVASDAAYADCGTYGAAKAALLHPSRIDAEHAMDQTRPTT
jgi:hypothetical protein